jgi:hypothetical protein
MLASSLDRFNWLLWSSASLWLNPGQRGDPIPQEFADAPDMISQPCSHGRSARSSEMFGLAQFMMIVVGEGVALSLVGFFMKRPFSETDELYSWCSSFSEGVERKARAQGESDPRRGRRL